MSKIFFSSATSTEFPENKIDISSLEAYKANREVPNSFGRVQKLIEKKLESIDVANYSKDINDIGIIPECQADWTLLHTQAVPERKYISWVKRSADMRLRVDFYAFKNADEQGRKALIVKNIIDSVKEIDTRAKKAKKDFDGERLIQDILAALSNEP